MATFSQSTVPKELLKVYYCAPCLKHKIDQRGERYCKKCLKAYCEECIIKHNKKFPKHKTNGRDEPSKWPVSKELQDFVQKCEGDNIEIFCDNYSQSQYAEVSVRGDPDQVFTVQGKSEYNLSPSEYNLSPPRDSTPNFDIQAICVLSDDQILVADESNERVKLLDQQYKVVGHCNLNACPTDMCLITPSEVAVVGFEDDLFRRKQYVVQFVSVDGGRLVMGKKIQFQHECHSIAHNLQDLYLTSGTALYKYSMSGELLKKMYEDTGWLTVNTCAVSPSGDKIFVTNHSHHKVLTLARDGTLLHTFTDPDLKCPQGIHVTALGQVLVCGGNSNTIIQLDGEGKQKLATLATERDGLYNPWSVCYNRSSASIIVGKYHSDKILVFKVK